MLSSLSPIASLRRATAILAALAISSAALACGGGEAEPQPSRDAYLEQVNAAQARFAKDAAKLDLASPSSARDFGSSLGSLHGLIGTLRARLDRIEAPDAVSREQDRLVAQLRDYGTAIERERGALSSGDARKAKAAAEAVGRASRAFSRDFDATIRRINGELGLETGSGS